MVLLAGCGVVGPGPTVAELDELDRRFVPPPPAEAEQRSDWVRQALKKEELSLDDALRLADLLNPELHALRRNLDIAAAEVWDASLYPNPTLVAETEDQRTRDLSTGKRVVGVEIPIVCSGRIGAATEVAQKEREAAGFRYVWERRRILAEVKKAFHQARIAIQWEDLARQTRDIVKGFHELAEKRFRAGDVPEMEVLKAAVDLARAEAELRSAQAQRANAVKELKTVIGDPSLQANRFGGALWTNFEVPSLETLQGHVLLGHPLVEIAERGREKARAELDLAKAEAWPDASIEVQGGREGGESVVQGTLAVPIPLFNRNQARIAAAEARLARAEFEVQGAKNAVLAQMAVAYHTFAAAQERVRLFRDEIVPKAQRALEQADLGYKSGQFNYLDVLDAQRTLAEARLAFLFAVQDLNVMAAELERITGSPLKGGP